MVIYAKCLTITYLFLMKKYYSGWIFCLYMIGFSVNAFAQKEGKYDNGNWIFLKNEAVKGARLFKANAYEIYYAANAPSNRRNRENVLFAFNDKGNYLIIEDIPEDTLKAQKYLDDFYKQPAINKDLIVLTRPLQVIRALSIKYVGDAINYINEQGKNESMSNERVIALLFKEGNFRLLGKPTEIVSSLKEALKEVKEARKIEKTKPEIIPANQIVTTPTSSKNRDMTKDEMEENRELGIQTIGRFNNYLQILCDKKETPSRKKDAENQILNLFVKEASVEVVSKKNPKDIRNYPIKDYLFLMRNRPYESIKVEWVNVNYVEEPQKMGDGTYQGKIRGEQRFSGLDKKGHVQYGDMTEKEAVVRFKAYTKVVGGQDTLRWQTLLGNIAVVDVREN